MTISACKKEAKNKIKSRKLRAFRITLCIAAAAILSGIGAFCLPQILTGEHDRYAVFASQSALLLASCGLLGTMRQGRAAWLYCSACGKEPSSVQFLFWIRKGRGFRAAALHYSVGIRKALWTVLLCIPGAATWICGASFPQWQTGMVRLFTRAGGAAGMVIGLVCAGVINQKYALAPVLFARSPKKGVRSAVRGSCALMDDSCLRMFLLKLSFLPWAALCLTVVPIVYVIPYYQQTTTCMLRDILRAHTI